MELTRKYTEEYSAGILLTFIIAYGSNIISSYIPGKLISGGVFALLLGMLFNPVVSKYDVFSKGMAFVSKRVLRFAIILMGVTLSFSQVVEVGRYSLFVMMFTLVAAFGGGYLLGKVFGMNWELSGLISAGTGICGASAVAAISESIDAKSEDIAYAISATFIFDIVMVVLFPIAGKYFGMTDLGFGLWTGTAVNDTSSVVAAGYAFSDAAGNFSVIVKLTRTLSIIPAVLIFSFIKERLEAKKSTGASIYKKKVDVKKIFPWFILMFLGVVGIKSTGIIPDLVSSNVATISKFLMVMSLGAIGLKTNFKEMSKSGFLPMIHGFLISALVVVVAFGVQVMMGML